MKTLIPNVVLLLLIVISSCTSCSKNEASSPDAIITPGDDPNFKIIANNDGVLNSFNRKVVVFGIDIYATIGVHDANLLHAANIMAQYLDNNEDGTVDNQKVLDKMQDNKAFVVMWKKESDLNIEPPLDREGQDLGDDETNPNFVVNGKTGQFDATLEEILHIITHAGYAYAYPNVFGENAGSEISNAMDIARGGHYTNIPNPYSSDAWYSYDDPTCEYDCQVTEYFYWAMTSILGAQDNRMDEIEHEWKLNTKEKVEQRDSAIFKLLTNEQYKLPIILPDGTYKR